jgi:hypothetical protein
MRKKRGTWEWVTHVSTSRRPGSGGRSRELGGGCR